MASHFSERAKEVSSWLRSLNSAANSLTGFA